MRTRIAAMAVGLATLASLGSGCSTPPGPIYRNYTCFLTHYGQDDLNALDVAGPEGARLIIGILAMDGQWKLASGPDGKCVEIEAIRVVRRTEIDGRVIEAPPQTLRGPWRVRNPFVIHWAETQTGAGTR